MDIFAAASRVAVSGFRTFERFSHSSFTSGLQAGTVAAIVLAAALGASFLSRFAYAQTAPAAPAWQNYHEAVARFCKGTGGVKMGDPVDVATGAVSLGETLGTLPGRLPFTLSWGFEAQDYSSGPLGTGTYLSCDYFITGSGTYGSGTYELFTPDNHHFIFTDNGDGNYSNTKDAEMLGAKFTSHTIAFGDGTSNRYYFLRWKGGTMFTFNPGGALVRIQDSFGNWVDIKRNGVGFATEITSNEALPAGHPERKIKLEYNGSYLSKITFPLNRVWQFTYRFYQDNVDTLLDTTTDPMGGVTKYYWKGYTRPEPAPIPPGDPSTPPDPTEPTEPIVPPVQNPPIFAPGDPILPPIHYPGFPVYPPTHPPIVPIVPVLPEPPIFYPPHPIFPPVHPPVHPPVRPPFQPPIYAPGDPNPIIADPPVTWLPYHPPLVPWDIYYVYMMEANWPFPDVPFPTEELPFPLTPSPSIQPSLLDPVATIDTAASQSISTSSTTNSTGTGNTGAGANSPNGAGTGGSVGTGVPIGSPPPPAPIYVPRPAPALLPELWYVVDRAGRTRILNFYDDAGRVVKQAMADGSFFHYTYAPGVTTMTAPNGDTTIWHFSQSGYGYNIVSVTNPIGQTTTLHRNGGSTNLPTSISDSQGRTVQFSWDEATGNLLSVTTPTLTNGALSGGTTTTSVQYDPVWNVPTQVFSPLGTVSATIDPMTGATTSVATPRGTTYYTYSEEGDLMSVKNPLGQKMILDYSALGELKSVTDHVGRETGFTYDDVSRLIAKFPPTDNHMRVNPAVFYAYNAMDQVTYMGDLREGESYEMSTLFMPWWVSYDYDDEGNLRQMSLLGEETWSWEYDAMDRVKKEIDPLGRATRLEYFPGGALQSVIDRKNQKTVYSYFPGNLPTSTRFYTSSGTLDSTISYAYKPGTDLLQSVTDTAHNTTYSMGYDALDRLISQTGPEGSLSWTLDDFGRRTSMTIPGGGTLSYVYSPTTGDLNAILQGTMQSYSIGARFSYDQLGRPTAKSIGPWGDWTGYDSQTTTWDYNEAGLLSHQKVQYGPNVLDERSFVFDVADRKKDEVVNGQTHHFKYNMMGNLTYADMGSNQIYKWGYGSSGNRNIQEYNNVRTTYQYLAGSDRLMSATRTPQTPQGGQPFTETGSYDNNGNMTRWGNTNYQWNVRGELTGITGGGDFGSFDYDSWGRRKAHPGDIFPGMWDGWGDSSAFSRDLSPNNVFDPQGTLVQTTVVGSGLTVATGMEFSYSPYGEVTRIDSNAASATEGTQNAQFAGMYAGNGSGLYYARNRYYNPVLGRFISEDPSGLMGGVNLYAYCHSDPVNFEDPLGLWESGSYWGDVGNFAKGEGGALVNFAANTARFALDPVGAITSPPLHVYSSGCSDAERSGEWFGDQLYAVGAMAAGFAKGGGLGTLFNKGGCFVAGTPVLMADGSYKPIEQVKEGDFVLARDTIKGTGETTAKRVENTSVRQVDGTLLLTFAGGATIEATDNHPFFVDGVGFVRADSLGIGSAIVTRAGPHLVVTQIEKKAAQTPAGTAVYNFTVEEFHSYFVGNPGLTGGGAWVHNGPPCPRIVQPIAGEERSAIAKVLSRINRGGPHPYERDGIVFNNRPVTGRTAPELPVQPQGYYKEYTVPTPGLATRGARRVVTGNGGEIYYTNVHYDDFIQFR